MIKKTDQKIIILELNEFNFDLMKDISEKHSFQNLKKILSYNHAKTITADTYDSGFLEPWSQWVSVHTGVPSTKHQIKHLGDVPDLKFKQIWEKLSEKGHRSIVFGVMNASRGKAKNCPYFLPDPWTYSEPGYPQQAADLLALPRYLAKNYLNIKIKPTIHNLLSFISAFDFFIFFSKISFIELFRTAKALIQYKFANFILISYFDFISIKLFLKSRVKYRTNIDFVFLNSIAHVQHHYWQENTINRIIYSYSVIDRALDLIFKNLRDQDELIIINALSQKNTNADSPWILYRQYDPVGFFKKLNLNIASVEQLMTHDSHLKFKSQYDRNLAYQVLSEVQIANSKLFFCEASLTDDLSMFIRLDFYNTVAPDIHFTINKKNFIFLEQFKAIVQRTGKHIQYGDLLCRRATPPKEIFNHEIYKYIVKLAD